MTPTARTLALLRKKGFTAGVVEKWIPQTRRRLDYLGFADIIAVGRRCIFAVQATSASNHSSRVNKTALNLNAAIWNIAGGMVCVTSWLKSRRTKLWTPRTTIISYPHESASLGQLPPEQSLSDALEDLQLLPVLADCPDGFPAVYESVPGFGATKHSAGLPHD